MSGAFYLNTSHSIEDHLHIQSSPLHLDNISTFPLSAINSEMTQLPLPTCWPKFKNSLRLIS